MALQEYIPKVISNISVDYFKFTDSQIFTLQNNIDSIIGINVQGQGPLNEDQFRVILPNQIEILDVLDENDYLVVQYTSGLLQLSNVYTKAQVDDLKFKSWMFLAQNWSIEPEMIYNDANGEKWKYTYKGVDRFRFVPIPYDPTLDAFYEEEDLINLITTKG